MKLVTALRLGPADLVALVGAGGKSTALFRLAHQSPPVFVTSTTHLAESQVKLGDFHFLVPTQDEVPAFRPDWQTGVVVFTGEPIPGGRVSGVDQPTLEKLHQLAKAHGVPLLIEADGARRLPLKAPADHEPAIPPFVDTVVVLAGMTALGKPLSPEWVHRPDRFAQLTGISPGGVITPEAICRELVHPAGGLKNIPARARKIVLLNQAEAAGARSSALGMASELLEVYDAVVVAALGAGQPGGASREDQLAGRVYAVHEPVAGIVLAAGGSRRLGQPKQLLPWKGKPFVRQVAETALQAGLHPIIVVTGAHANAVGQVLHGLDVKLAHNPDWEAGQSTSVRRGLSEVPLQSGGAVFLLCDQPQVTISLLQSLLESHARTLAPVTAPLIDGQRGNPVLFDRTTFPDFELLSGDVGARSLFARYPVRWVTWHDSAILLDVDTPEDLQKLTGGPDGPLPSCGIPKNDRR